MARMVNMEGMERTEDLESLVNRVRKVYLEFPGHLEFMENQEDLDCLALQGFQVKLALMARPGQWGPMVPLVFQVKDSKKSG